VPGMCGPGRVGLSSYRRWRNVTIDWTAREAVRAKLRTMVKRIMRKHGYPPDKQEKATQTVLGQAELLCKD
jgi:type I restriction enzyme R subunit